MYVFLPRGTLILMTDMLLPHDLLHLILAAESVGVDIRVNQRQDVEYLFAQVARHLTRVQEQGLGKPGLENLKAFA